MRVVVTLTPGSAPEAVLDALRTAGATYVRPPRPEDPEVVVAELADDAELEPVRALPEVRSAEPDQLRWSQSD